MCRFPAGLLRGGIVKNILVIDDDHEWRHFACSALASTYPVQVAESAEEGLRIARATPPALIILDIMMPGGLDGFGALRELREDPVTREVPVILLSEVNALTGLSFSEEMLQQYLGVTPSAFLEKPIGSTQLLAEVQTLIG